MTADKFTLGIQNIPARTVIGNPTDKYGPPVPLDSTDITSFFNIGGNYLNAKLYGVKGDGSDETSLILAAQTAAAAANRPLYFEAGTYGFSGQLSINSIVKWIGEGLHSTIFKRVGQDGGGASISMSGAEVHLEGIAFDFDKATFPGSNTWGLLLNTSVLKARIHKCKFSKASGSIGYGVYIAGNGTTTENVYSVGWYDIINCEFDNNAQSGIWVTNSDRVNISDCISYSNGADGFRIDTQDSLLAKTNQRTSVTNCMAWGNSSGFSIGNLNMLNSGVNVLWDIGFSDARYINIDNCQSFDNTSYGIYLCGEYVDLNNMQSRNNGTAQMNMLARNCTISGGTFDDGGQANPWNIDMGVCYNTTFTNLKIIGGVIGISGLPINCKFTENTFLQQTTACVAFVPMETDGSGVAFQGQGSGALVDSNTFILYDNTVKGVKARDGYQGLSITNNDFFIAGTATASLALFNCISVYSDKYMIKNNRYLNDRAYNHNPTGSTYNYPDVLDELSWTVSSYSLGTIANFRPNCYNDLYQKVGWVRTTHRGNGGATPFTGTMPTSVTFSGGGGSGAAGTPFFDQDGYLMGIRMTNNGSGYTSAPTASVTGTGGANVTYAVGYSGYLPTGHRVTIYSLNQMDLGASSGTPAISGKGGYSTTRISYGESLTLSTRFNLWYLDHVKNESNYGAKFDTWTTLNNQMSAATVSAGGTGYTVGDTLTLTGTGSAQVKVKTVSSGVITSISLVAGGNIASPPANPIATTGGTGTGATINATWVANSLILADTVSELSLTPAGTITAGTVVLPPFPADGQSIEINTTQTITTLTVIPNTGHTLQNTVTTLAANTYVKFRYRMSTNIWRKIS